jgi:hypothetical protein
MLMLTSLELIDHLAALIPPPRLRRHRYHGMLAPSSPLRAAATDCPGTGGRGRAPTRSRTPYSTGTPWHSPSPRICSTSRCSGSLSRRPALRAALKPLRAPHRQRGNPRPPQAHRTSGPRDVYRALSSRGLNKSMFP